jgi:hypothetical protein
LIFKNQAAGVSDKPQKGEFVNDLLRSEFHKKFMQKSVALFKYFLLRADFSGLSSRPYELGISVKIDIVEAVAPFGVVCVVDASYCAITWYSVKTDCSDQGISPPPPAMLS